MSDLTITLAGESVTKKTGGEILTPGKKLTQMNVDVIDVTVAIDGGAYIAGEVFFIVTKIPNAVAVKGGSAILQSVSAIGTSTAGDDLGSFDLILTSDSTVISAAINTVPSANTDVLATMDGTLGKVSITNMIDAGVCMIGNKANIGMVCKAEAASRSLHVFGIARSTDDYEQGSAILRLGFVKD